MSIRSLLLICLLLAALSAPARPLAQLYSPNGRIAWVLHLEAGLLRYDLSFDGKPVLLDSPLELITRGGRLTERLKAGKAAYSGGVSEYTLHPGKTSQVSEAYREVLLPLRSAAMGLVHLRVRAYDSGLAFRYEYPKQPGRTAYELLDELSSFRFAAHPQAYALLLDRYTTSHEGLYTRSRADSLPQDLLIDLPAVFELPGSCFVAVTEANLRNYAGMYLQHEGSSAFVSRLSPLPGQPEVKVRASLPHQSPWRVILVSEHVAGLLEANLLTSLCDPPAFEDLSWIRPGKTTWTWWNGDIYKAVPFEPGQNFETHQFHIDFCAANHIQYHSIIEHGNIAWYQGDGEGFDPPPPHADVTKPVPTLDMERLAAYSREKGVGLRVWVHWKPLSERLDSAFALYERWNVQGLMVDFMDRDDQEMVNWVEQVLRTAAKHHLHVQFHGAYKPTGLHRTFPNELTREGVLNLENLKWGKECDPEHNLMVPFTRMIAGPMDYHTGGFRALPRAQFEASFLEPHVLGTRCHHLAMYVVYESYLQMVSDYPEAYTDQPGFELIRQVPAAWDEIRVLEGRIGDYLALARRSGDEWYLGVMNDWTPRSLELKLDFLGEGTYEAVVWQDAPESAADPDRLERVIRTVTRADVLTAGLAGGGGQVVWFRKK